MDDVLPHKSFTIRLSILHVSDIEHEMLPLLFIKYNFRRMTCKQQHLASGYIPGNGLFHGHVLEWSNTSSTIFKYWAARSFIKNKVDPILFTRSANYDHQQAVAGDIFNGQENLAHGDNEYLNYIKIFDAICKIII